MKIGGEIVIGKDDAAGASAVRKPPEDRRDITPALTLASRFWTKQMHVKRFTDGEEA